MVRGGSSALDILRGQNPSTHSGEAQTSVQPQQYNGMLGLADLCISLQARCFRIIECMTLVGSENVTPLDLVRLHTSIPVSTPILRCISAPTPESYACCGQ